MNKFAFRPKSWDEKNKIVTNLSFKEYNLLRSAWVSELDLL